jgi:hypothetical protein
MAARRTPAGHGETLLRRESDGSFVVHADLSGVCTGGCDEIVVDGRGNVYVNSTEFDFLGGGEPTGVIIALITPDGSVRQVGLPDLNQGPLPYQARPPPRDADSVRCSTALTCAFL